MAFSWLLMTFGISSQLLALCASYSKKLPLSVLCIFLFCCLFIIEIFLIFRNFSYILNSNAFWLCLTKKNLLSVYSSLFIFLEYFLRKKKYVILRWSNLYIFSSKKWVTFWVLFRKFFPILRSWNFSLHFKFLPFPFKTLIHLKCIFV